MDLKKNTKTDIIRWFSYNQKEANPDKWHLTNKNKKYNCSGLPAFKSQRVGY